MSGRAYRSPRQSLPATFENGVLNENCRAGSQIPDVEGCVKEGYSEVVPRENYDHKVMIMGLGRFSSSLG